MKQIILNFLTETGVDAYNKVEEAGKKESWKSRQVSKRVCTDRVVSKNPLVIEINVKIPRLAVQVDLPSQIKQGLAKFHAVENTDYTMEVM